MKDLWNFFTDKLGRTIFHPQYIMNSFTWEGVDAAINLSRNKEVLDIGCGRMNYKEDFMRVVKKYTGVDHPSVSKLYKPKEKPDIFADAANLPLKNSSYDTCLLLQVIEYLGDPQKSINEALRVVKKDGFLIITSPFLYPIHDGKLDRTRFTASQLKDFFKDKKVKVTIKFQGGFFDFIVQNILVFLFKSALKFPLLILPGLLITPLLNIFALILRPVGKLFSANNDFPLDYLVIVKKK